MFAHIRLRAKLLLPLGAAVLFFPAALLLCFRCGNQTDPVGAERRNAVAAGQTTGNAAQALPPRNKTDEGNTRTVPVLMYHSVCDHPTARSVYILSPAAFREDLRYLSVHGYQTVFLRDLLAFAGGTGTLPEKPVVLTFDDGFYNNLTNVLPLLKEADAKAELNIVGRYADNAGKEQYRSPDYSYLTWEEIRTLQGSGRFEIGSHTYDMHALSPRNGCAREKGESDEAYENALKADAAAMREAMLREQTDATLIFAYPYGAKSRNTQTILEQAGFTVFLTCDERLNVLSKNSPLPPLCRINRTAALTTEEFMKKNGIG